MSTQTISSLSEYLSVVLKTSDSSVLYRGERLLSRKIIPKIGRVKVRGGNDFSPNDELIMLRNFKKRAEMHLSFPLKSDLEWLMLAQHHGLPTRLLDFTSNPLVALYFAVEKKSEPKDGDSVVYQITERQSYRQEAVTDPFKVTQDMFFNPFYNNKRMVSQQSRFMLCAKPNQELSHASLDRIVIDSGSRKKIKIELNVCGINRMNLFASLASIAEQIEWVSTEAF